MTDDCKKRLCEKAGFRWSTKNLDGFLKLSEIWENNTLEILILAMWRINQEGKYFIKQGDILFDYYFFNKTNNKFYFPCETDGSKTEQESLTKVLESICEQEKKSK